MTDDQITRAASMWNRRMDTALIAKCLMLREAQVARHLDAIRARAKGRIERFEYLAQREAAQWQA